MYSMNHTGNRQSELEHRSEQRGELELHVKFDFFRESLVKMHPSREEFTELIYYISELKHQYSNKIDEQSIKINDQSGVIEELLWQVRELSDKLRQMNQKIVDMEKQLHENSRRSEEKFCVCRYENHIPINRSIFSRQTSMISRRNAARIAKIDKTIEGDDSDSNDVYETIEFSDSSSNVYTEPVRDYGVLRKVNIKTSPTKPPRQISGNKKPPSGLKKSSGSRNLQKHKALHDVSETANEDIEPSVELRLKPHRAANTEVLTSKHDNSLISDVAVQSTPTENLDRFTPLRDVSGILINFECSKSRLKSDFQERLSY